MSTTAQEFYSAIISEVAAMIAKTITINEREVAIILAEILASDYKLTPRGNREIHAIHKDVQRMATQIAADRLALKISEEVTSI